MKDHNGEKIQINDGIMYIDANGKEYEGIVKDFVDDKLIKIECENNTMIVKTKDVYWLP